MTHATVTIQITSASKPSTPSWMGEGAAFAQILEQTGTLKVVQNQVRFARARARSLRSHRFCRGAHRLHPCLPNRPCWLFTNGSLNLPSHVWPCLGEIVCPIARRFLVFPDALDPASVEGLRSLCAKGLACAEAVSFCWWPVRPTRCRVSGDRCRWDPTSCPRALRCRRQKPCLLPIGGLIRCALRAIKAASGGK